MNIHQTREAWLVAATDAVRPWFAEAGKPLEAPVRLAMGLPSVRALSSKNRRVGECWSATASTDGTHEIFISPVLADPVDIVGTVIHELVHAAVGLEAGHKAPFKRLATSLGLTGKMTATTVGDSLRDRLEPVLEALGPLPHARFTGQGSMRKKDGIRQLKTECPTCGYIARTSQKWLDLGGAPFCPIDVGTQLVCADAGE